MQQLSKMQQRIYDYIAACIRDQGYPPSVREIGEAVGLKSPSTVHFHLKRLEVIKRRLNHILADNTGKSVETVTADCERDNFMSAEEAMEYGLIDKVIYKR